MKIPQMIPWFDQREVEAVSDYMASGGWVMEFKKTEELENMICEFTGVKNCIMTVNGTVALELALTALGIGWGDEVLVPDLTMIASPNSCVRVGAKPVMVDIDPLNLCLDFKKTEKLITKKTKALMYVPLNGRSHNMSAVRKFCKKNKLFLIEDAAQALGSYWGLRHLGTFGEIGTLSFSTQKIISMGQGGALLTNDNKLAKVLRRLKNFGRDSWGGDRHDYIGWNYRYTDIQAVIGIEQMKKLGKRIKRKKEIYKRYQNNLSKISRVEMLETDLNLTTPWFADIYVDKPDLLAQQLQVDGIGTRKIYPAIHTQKIYKSIKEKFTVSTKYAKRGLWLPSSSQLTNEEIDFVCEKIKNFFANY